MNIKSIGLTALVFFVFSGNVYAQDSDIGMETAGSRIIKTFGSFLLPDEWVEITQYSRNGKYFYSHKSEKIGLAMTNISVEMGKNPYALEDHMTFRYAILRQLLMQTGGRQVNGSGTFTKNGYPLYIFTIFADEPHVTTTQYYIIGDKKHILIHLTDFHNGNIVNSEVIAKDVAESFIWPE